MSFCWWPPSQRFVFFFSLSALLAFPFGVALFLPNTFFFLTLSPVSCPFRMVVLVVVLFFLWRSLLCPFAWTSGFFFRSVCRPWGFLLVLFLRLVLGGYHRPPPGCGLLGVGSSPEITFAVTFIVR
ncbi:uncharacterized protein BYT42DRAFT_418543 [Radiomyces spectabilis]|uniref:uncharacterized protein n=1 Tax=Radiomyces spectabilis TaxID=64574 RepID=UPI002220EEF3|nr:uncharacterized protein BYT42DRAFT_418543 [Radiomyces spectabilis]KAI8374758.1 hypothetical protein BYT42DRAFT_418543 [Radiomyces spectabilis]